MKSFLKHTLFFLALGLFVFVHNADAASFALSPVTGVYSVGDKFTVSVVLKTTEAVNAGVGQISFDNTRLAVESIQHSTSLFTLWTEEPTYSNAKGTIAFSGGVPNPGFVGVSGNVFRIVFKVIADGSASVKFLSGSILANDGKGTNTLEGLGSAGFSLVPAKAVPAPVAPDVKSETQPVLEGADAVTAKKILDVPTFTTWPSTLSVGDILTIHGLGIPQAKIKVSIQKDNENMVSSEVYAGFDGRFVFTYQKAVEKGTYRLSLQNELNGEVSTLSEQISVSVLPSPFFHIGNLLFSYLSLAMTLMGILIVVIGLLIFVHITYHRWKREEGEKISHTEHLIHKLFDLLREGMRGYVNRVDPKIEREIEKKIDAVEKDVEKSLERIKK